MTDLLEIPHDFNPVLSRNPDVHVGVVADHVEPEGLQDGVTFMPGAGKVLEWADAQNCRRILGAFWFVLRIALVDQPRVARGRALVTRP